MITKYNQYIKESLLNKLVGLNKEEVWNNLLKKYNNNYDNIIFAAARANYVDGVKKSLEEIRKQDDDELGFPVDLLLNDTISYGSIDVLKYLIEEEDASVEGYYGHNLENATSNNEPEIIKYLISKGADVNVNKGGPLWKAMSNGYVECAKELLEAGAKLEPYMVGVVDKKNKPMLDLLKNYVVVESLLDKLEGPSEEEVIKNIEHKDLEDQLNIFVNNGYMKGILKIKKMFDDDIFGDEIEGFKNFKHILSHINLNTEILDYPDVLEFLDKQKTFNIFTIDSFIKTCILKSKKESLNYLLNNYNKNAKEILSNKPNRIYLSNPILRRDFGIVEVLLNNGMYDSDPYYFFSNAIKYNGEEMGEMFIKKYNFNESLLNKLEGPSKEEVLNNLNKKLRLKIINAELYIGYLFMYGLEDNVIDFLNTKIDIKIGDNIDFYLKEIIFYSYLHDKKDIRDYIFNHYYINNIILNGVYERIKNARVSFKTPEMFSDAINSISTYLNSNESLLNKLEGPSEEDVLNILKDNPDKLLKVSLKSNFLKGINIALENGAIIKNLWNVDLYDKVFKLLNYNEEQIIKTLEIPSVILDYAVFIKNKELIKYSLETGASLNDVQINDFYYKSPELFKFLYKSVKNFKINYTFIKKLLYRKKIDDIKNLIDLGCIDVNEDGLDLLYASAFIGNKESVEIFLNNGVKIPKDFNFDDIMYDDIIEILKNNIEK